MRPAASVMAVRLARPAAGTRRNAPPDGDAGRDGSFRFSFSSAERYRRPSAGTAEPPLFRRWEAVGLLLLVTVGAAFVPAGSPPAATLLMEAARIGPEVARPFSLAPPLFALFFAWRASARLSRPFDRLWPVMLVATLSATSVLVAFHLGLYLALAAGLADPTFRLERVLSTLPGALAGLTLLLVVATIRLAARRATRELDRLRRLMDADERERP